MKLIIDLPDYWKIRIENNRRPDSIECGRLVESVWRGKALPKEHGRLIDADALKQSFEKQYDFFLNAYGGSFSQMPPADKARIDEISNSIAEVINSPTIIEANKEKNK